MVQFSSSQSSDGHEYHGHATEFLKRTIFFGIPPPPNSRPINLKSDQRLTMFREAQLAWKQRCTQEDRNLITIIKDNSEDLDYLFHGLMSLVDLCVVSLQIPLPSHISIHGKMKQIRLQNPHSSSKL